MAQAGINVTVDHSPPQKLSDGSWQINVWAVAQHRGRDRQPASGERIEFFVDGIKQSESETENDGRTPTEIVTVPPEKTAVAIEAQPAGDATRRSKKIVNIEEKSKKPAEIRIFRGTPAEIKVYPVTVHVLTEDGTPLKGEQVFIKDPEADPIVKRAGVLDENGQLTFDLQLRGERKEIVVMVGDKSKLHLIYR